MIRNLTTCESVRDYKWINSIQLQKTWEQMHIAYERQATKMWVINVGDLKPLVSALSIPITVSNLLTDRTSGNPHQPRDGNGL